VEARFPAPVQNGPGAHPASCTTGSVSFLGVKRPGRGVDPHHYPALRLKKEYSCTSIPHWTFVACSRVNFNFTVTISYLPLSYLNQTCTSNPLVNKLILISKAPNFVISSSLWLKVSLSLFHCVSSHNRVTTAEPKHTRVHSAVSNLC
jgi:hypothetical protein